MVLEHVLEKQCYSSYRFAQLGFIVLTLLLENLHKTCSYCISISKAFYIQIFIFCEILISTGSALELLLTYPYLEVF